MNFETENIEFKSQFTEDIYKEVIAFANTDGGILYIGIDDEGNAVGLKDVDEEYTRITNGIRDAILPDITMFVRYSIQENKVVRITVNEGTNKPYYLKGKGLKPSGVFVRQGTSSVPASLEQIRKMIKESDGDSFEMNRSLQQQLTFKTAEDFFTQEDLCHEKDSDYRNRRYHCLQTHGQRACSKSDRCRSALRHSVHQQHLSGGLRAALQSGQHQCAARSLADSGRNHPRKL